MATGEEWNCPICCEASGNIAYVGSCLHQFCRGCILRWARKNPSCPLCRQTVHTIIYAVPPDQSFIELAVPQPLVPRSTSPWEELGAAEPQHWAHLAGFPPETWAFFFRNHAEILRPVELWLNEVLCGNGWWDVAFAQGRIMASLCRYGLHEEALVWEVQPFLQDQTATFVRQLIEVATDRCSDLVWRRVDTVSQQASPGAVAFPGSRRSTTRGWGRPAGPGPRTPRRGSAAAPESPGSPAGAEAVARRTPEQPTRSRTTGQN